MKTHEDATTAISKLEEMRELVRLEIITEQEYDQMRKEIGLRLRRQLGLSQGVPERLR